MPLFSIYFVPKDPKLKLILHLTDSATSLTKLSNREPNSIVANVK